MSAPPAYPARFPWPALIGAILYLALESVYIWRLPMGMDEFNYALYVSDLAHGLPYRDFAPYKTVLGYYYQLPVLMAASDPWSGMLAVKLQAVLTTAVVLVLATWRLSRAVRAGPLLLSLVSMACVSHFLERSGELRVDMLTALVGLGSLVLLLERRWVAAGLVAGTSFLVSQRGLYFCVAGLFAASLPTLSRTAWKSSLKTGLTFGFAATAPLVVYIALFATISSVSHVIHTIFVYPQASIWADYPGIRMRFWGPFVGRNLLFTLLMLGAPGVLFWAGRLRERRLAVYTLTVLAGCGSYQHPWPYTMVLFLPTCWVAVAFALQHLDDVLSGTVARPVLFSVILGGSLLPLARIPGVLTRDNTPQQEAVAIARQVLGDEESYLAGTPMVRDRRHASREHLEWLDRARLVLLEARDSETLDRMLETDPPKLVFWNYRLTRMPVQLREDLQRDWVHWRGAMLTYCPRIRSADQALGYAGRYWRADAPEEAWLELPAGPLHRPDLVGRQLCLQVADDHTPSSLTPLPEDDILFPNIYGF